MKKIKNFNYWVTKDGKVFNSKNKQLKPFKNVDGYNCLILNKGGVRSHKRVCRLVAETYIGNKNNLPIVNHKNSIRDDDRVENLEWCTTLYNNLHGIHNNPEKHRANANITEEQAHKICALLQDGLRLKDISELTSCSLDIVSHISSGKTWKVVSSQYNFPPKRSRVSVKTAQWVIDQLSLGLSYEDILKKSSNKRLSLKIISLIDSKRIYKEIFNK